jgi:hypothetical protein
MPLERVNKTTKSVTLHGGIWGKRPFSTYPENIWRVWETTKILDEDELSLGLDSKTGSPKYETRVLCVCRNGWRVNLVNGILMRLYYGNAEHMKHISEFVYWFTQKPFVAGWLI